MTTQSTGYAITPWYPEHGSESIHPDDWSSFANFRPAGKVFKISKEGDWVRLRYGDHSFRVRRDLIRSVPAPRFHIGDSVRAKQHGAAAQATIVAIEWHHKLDQPMYFLRFGEKRSSRRYYDEEVEPPQICA
jgi:hypothetical protein